MDETGSRAWSKVQQVHHFLKKFEEFLCFYDVCKFMQRIP